MVELPQVGKIRDYRLDFYFVVKPLSRIIKLKVNNAGNDPDYPMILYSSLYEDVDH